MKTATTTVFDQANSVEAIHEQLQVLVKDLLAAITPGRAVRIVKDETVNLRILTELSYAELKSHPRPVHILSEICRLLFKFGDTSSLKQGLALAHTLYAFKCEQNESWYLSYLYRGIAQIGLGMADLGVKNVTGGLAGHGQFLLDYVDRALGYWALTSAAIANRNLKLAATFAQQWHQAADDGNLSDEHLRSGIARYLLALVLGDIGVCSHPGDALRSATPKAWGNTVRYLDTWTQVMQTGIPVEPGEVSEPYPLFLGIEWYHPPQETPEPDLQSRDFALLCEIRRTFCHTDAITTLSPEQIERYANCLAYWELPRPLYDFETILKHKAVAKNLQYVMTRLLGRQVLETVTNKTPVDPEVVRQEKAVILVMDVRRFSALSENRTPEEIFDLLNPIFKIMHEELEQAQGTILEFIGDCIIIVFNTFKNQQTRMTDILHHSMRALHRIRIHNAMSCQAGLPEITIGVGLNKGPVALGYLGGLPRCHLTVLGNTINLASRIESSSKELPGEVIVSEFCFDGDMPDVWTEPGTVNFSVRDLGKHTMRNIQQPVHLFGLSPLIRSWVDFVPMGFVASPEPGIVFIDTGNSGEPGIIDHHHPSYTEQSACELLIQRPELLLEHLAATPPSQREFRLHQSPDLDCAATLYAAYELLGKTPRTRILQKLARYVSCTDQGRIPEPDHLSASLFGIAIAHQRLMTERYGKQLTDVHLLEAELRVIDAAVYLMEAHDNGEFFSIFYHQLAWFPEEQRLIREDRDHYHLDLAERSHTYTARVNGVAEPVTGLWVDHPQSIFFKLWARNDPNAPGGRGYQFLVFNWSQPGKHRFIISVAPEAGTNLNGLGQLLERHEAEKRKRLGKERPIQPIRYPADNSDPWYFGQGHRYTIIDSPWEGTVLTPEEVQQIHASWEGELR